MNKQLADIAIRFLSRITLAPHEIKAFCELKQALENIENEVKEVPESHEMEDK